MSLSPLPRLPRRHAGGRGALEGHAGLLGLVAVEVDVTLQVELGGERLVAVFTAVDAAGRIDRIPLPRFALLGQVSVERHGRRFFLRHRSDGIVRFRRSRRTSLRRSVILENDAVSRDALVVVVTVVVVIVVVVIFSVDVVVAVDVVVVVVEAEQELDVVGAVQDVEDVRNIDVVKLPVGVEL